MKSSRRRRPPKVRTGQGSVALTRAQFAERFAQRHFDPAFADVQAEIDRIREVAWQAYQEARKSPRVRAAGAGFADPRFELSTEWLETRRRLHAAAKRQRTRKTPSRILIVCGASRSDQTCPGEMSKTFRLASLARRVIERTRGFEADLLDLSSPRL